MVTVEDILKLTVVVNAGDAADRFNKLQQQGMKMARANDASGGVMSRSIERVQKSFVKGSAAQKAFSSGLDIQNKKMGELKNKFDMNTLSWTFGGLALQQLGVGMMKFLIPSVDKLVMLQTTAAKKTLGVVAAFEMALVVVS